MRTERDTRQVPAEFLGDAAVLDGREITAGITGDSRREFQAQQTGGAELTPQVGVERGIVVFEFGDAVVGADLGGDVAGETPDVGGGFGESEIHDLVLWSAGWVSGAGGGVRGRASR